MSEISSVLLDNAVNEFSKLPGIGRKTALRMVLHLLRQSEADVSAFSNAMIDLKQGIHYCKVCHNISDDDVCAICADASRDDKTICVVENIKDIMSIENTQQYKGLYHVLGGVISPMNGVGPADLEIASLVDRVQQGGIEELIFALSPTMEGDTTCFYISRRLQNPSLKLTVLARGVAVGDELEYADEVTLGRSIVNRMPFDYNK